MSGLEKTMERLARQVHRRTLHKVWRSVKEGSEEELGPQERKLFAILCEHTEYAPYFEDEALLDGGEFAGGETVNPFLHISLHQMVEDQLEAETPIEAVLLCEALEMAGHSRHDAVHAVITVLVPLIHESLVTKQPFNRGRYIHFLRACRKLPLDEIGPFMEREWNRRL